MKIEARAYGPDSTDEEIRLLQDRVQLYNEDTILLTEIPVMSLFSIETTANEIGRYLEDERVRYIIIDLVGVGAPDAALRAKLKECYSKYTNQIDHVAYFTEMNVILNLIAKFMVRTIGYKKYSFHKTKEQALKAIRNE